MDIQQLYKDFGVDYQTEGKHTRQGWIGINCPWCSGSQDYHLGYNLTNNFFTCFRCGYHPIVPTIALVLRVDNSKAYKIVKEYGLLVNPYVKPQQSDVKIEFKLPSGIMPLTDQHKRYLEKRLFDPEYLERKYNLQSTGPIALLDHSDYRHRIMIPYYWNYEQVSFDSRDVTGKNTSKYMACPKNREIIPHKEILYGAQEKWNSTGICVEGCTDVWRFGDNSFAVSGIKYTPKQVRLITKTFKRVFVCFDGEESQALEQANKLVSELKFRGVDSFRVDIEGDPGGMDQKEANYLVKQLTK